jgi:hypothetical protein
MSSAKSRQQPASRRPYPGFIVPALATSSDKVPKGERWIHEIKFDGHRVQLHIANESTTVFTRRGIDWTRLFKKIAKDAFLINANSAVIDGEMVVPAADGTHGLFGAAERAQGQVDQHRDGRRPALSQRLRPAEAAACEAKIPPEKADRQDRDSVQRKFRGRRTRDVQGRLLGLARGMASKVRDSRFPAGAAMTGQENLRAARDTADRPASRRRPTSSTVSIWAG